MENKINLLKELVNKEKELYGEDDSSFITDQVEKMIEYRNIRTEQAWFSKATDGMTQRKIATAELISRLCRTTGFIITISVAWPSMTL